MSIIERAAGKISPSQQPAEAPAPASTRSAEISHQERNLIEASINRVEESFGLSQPVPQPVSQPAPPPSAQPAPPAQPTFSAPRPAFAAAKAADEEGPATVLSQAGSVDLNRLRQMGGLTPDAGRTQMAEEYRLIKRPLLTNAFGQGDIKPMPNGNMIMVTSSIPGEGKSFTAINLAISMATEMENTVLLVDADVTKTAVMRYLGLQGDRGLLDVLVDPTIPLSDVLIKTDIAKLTILPAGRNISHATELLASTAMQSFVNDIASRYPDRIVIFDTPPLLATSEASVLASYMGQVVFVVEAERTPQGAIKEALSQLKGNAYVGMILNKAPARTGTGDYYGYGYGYGYGGYGSYGEQRKK